MYTFMNPHPKGCLVGDCVKRALTIATGEDYREVSRQLNRIKRELNADKFNSDEVWWEFVNRRGYKAETYQAVKGQKRMNGERFCDSHPTGKYILVMAGHLSCCIDGIIYDTWDCSSKCVYRSIRVA